MRSLTSMLYDHGDTAEFVSKPAAHAPSGASLRDPTGPGLYPHTADVSIHESRAESVDQGRIDTAFLSSGLLIRDRREVGRAA